MGHGVTENWLRFSQKSTDTGRPIASHNRADLSGVAAMGAGFVVTDGQGATWRLDQDLALLEQHPLAWDNHLIAI